MLKVKTFFDLSRRLQSTFDFKLVVAGGGSGGITMANKLSKYFGQDEIAVIEPADTHYYQPIWTLVGAGIKSMESSGRPMGTLIPKKAKWFKQPVAKLFPERNQLELADLSRINYQYLIVALGIDLDFERVKGLPEAFETPGVCSNYSPATVLKTRYALSNFREGNAIFTFPNTPIKCPGAPQKIMYLSDAYFRRKGIRDKVNIVYNTSLPVIFGVKKYADALWKIVHKRNMKVNNRKNLIEVRPDSKEAIFEHLDTGEKTSEKYEMLHVAPPCKPKSVLAPLADATGFVDVNKETLQHTKFPNVFALGDCSNLPTAKTAAAVAAESKVVAENFRALLQRSELKAKYDGYTSCPLVTGNGKAILAEFDYNLQPTETFPINQGKERYSMYLLKSYGIPFVYWNLMTKGYWEGPGLFRKIMHLGMV